LDLVVGFGGFFALLIICIIKNIPICLILIFGLLVFSLICYRRGFSWPHLFQMMKKGSKYPPLRAAFLINNNRNLSYFQSPAR
jgi:hypothetical protein